MKVQGRLLFSDEENELNSKLMESFCDFNYPVKKQVLLNFVKLCTLKVLSWNLPITDCSLYVYGVCVCVCVCVIGYILWLNISELSCGGIWITGNSWTYRAYSVKWWIPNAPQGLQCIKKDEWEAYVWKRSWRWELPKFSVQFSKGI